MVDHFIMRFFYGPACQINHARLIAAAGKPNIGLARFARTIDHTADNRQRNRLGNMGQPIFQSRYGFNHVKALAGT